jgi:hypothetical protein
MLGKMQALALRRALRRYETHRADELANVIGEAVDTFGQFSEANLSDDDKCLCRIALGHETIRLKSKGHRQLAKDAREVAEVLRE